MTLADDERNYVDLNGAACELMGMTREEFLECKVEHLSAPEFRDLAQ